MPGGGIDGKTEKEMLDQIIRVLPVYSRIPQGEESIVQNVRFTLLVQVFTGPLLKTLKP